MSTPHFTPEFKEEAINKQLVSSVSTRYVVRGGKLCRFLMQLGVGYGC